MVKKLSALAIICTLAGAAYAQKVKDNTLPNAGLKDSVVVKAHPSYNDRSAFHRFFFGENYRKEWAQPVKLPVIHISTVYGGLKPLKAGGGMQTQSLRLADKNGNEYALRSVEKTPDKLVSKELQETFAVDWLDDALSEQHPYSALIVPPLARAARVPHSNPIIGVVADDPALGEFRAKFANKLCLLEEREPEGESDNTVKALGKLLADNDNHFDGPSFLRARLLDLLLADWDRHEDQWRWHDAKKGKDKFYEAIPRDRDQVFHVIEGVIPNIAALGFVNPALDDFGATIPFPQYSLYKTRFIKYYLDAQMSYDEWMRITNEFVAAETDAVLEEGLRKLPVESYQIGHDKLLAKLKGRRDAIPKAMDAYYKFIYRLVDIRTSDKNEAVTITDAPDGGMLVNIRKISKTGVLEDTLLNLVYKPEITKEIRLYTIGGDDRVTVNYTASPIKLRLIGGAGNKVYDGIAAPRKVKLYDKPDSILFTGNAGLFSTHLSRDSGMVQFQPTHPYNVWQPLATAALNADDGFLLGLGAQYTKFDGFRKTPYTSRQQLLIAHSFATDAFRIRYSGEWIKALGKADILMNAYIQAPDNTLNFFGFGNNTPLVKGPNFRRYYRTRFNTFQFDPALRWTLSPNRTISVGPSLELYRMDPEDNQGRLIKNTSLINSYDSLIINEDKGHAGFVINFVDNQRRGGVFPNGGHYFTVRVEGYRGLNEFSKSFAQIRPEFTFYKKLTKHGALVLADRIGGGITVGNPAFYQGMYLGGQGNLLGYLQNRFAGKHMIYNNLQARLKLANIRGYILPGQFGVSGFYDAGRVWADGEESNVIHQGVGAGAYFSPAALVVVQVLAGHSSEGWYPYVSLNFRL